MERRTFLKLGLGSTLAFSGAGYFIKRDLDQHFFKNGVLDQRTSSLILSLAPAIVGVPLSKNEKQIFLNNFEKALSSLPDYTLKELNQLFKLMTHFMTRFLMTGLGRPWEEASLQEVTAFLNRWQVSPISLFREGHSALVKLVGTSYYAASFSWEGIGYPGIPEI